MPNFFDQFDPPAGAATTAQPRPNFFDQFDQPAAPTQAAPQAVPPTTAAAGGPQESWFERNVLAPGRYIGGMLGVGALGAGQAMGQAEVGSMAGGAEAYPTTDPRQLIFGTTAPQAPGPVSRYAGALAEAVGQNPLLAAIAPEATVGGALAGQAALDVGAPGWGAALAGAVGGGLAGAARTGLGLLMGANTVRSLAKSVGSSESEQVAGGAVQSAANRWLDVEMPAAERQAWAPLDAAIPRTAAMPHGPQVDLTNTENTLKGILKIGAADPREIALAKAEGGGAANRLWEMLTEKGPGGPIPPARPGGIQAIATGMAPTTIDPMSWDTVRGIRSWIGEGMRDPILKGMGQKNLDRLYASLSQDLKGTAAANGAGDLFDSANAESSRLRALAEDHIGPIAQADTPGQAYQRAMQRSNVEGTRLQVLRDNIPDATGELASAHLLQTPRGWARLSDEAKVALVPDVAKRQRIDAAVGREIAPAKGEAAVPAILGGELGAHIGQAVLNGLLGPGRGEAIGSVVGAVAPSMIRGGVALARQPSALRFPAIGAIAAPTGP